MVFFRVADPTSNTMFKYLPTPVDLVGFSCAAEIPADVAVATPVVAIAAIAVVAIVAAVVIAGVAAAAAGLFAAESSDIDAT